MKRISYPRTSLILLLILLIMLSSCNRDVPITPVPTQTESSPLTSSPIPSESIEPTKTDPPTITPSPSITPEPSQPPTRPSEYTDSKYFVFDEINGVILDYNMEGGIYVNIPETINGKEVKSIGWRAFYGKRLYGIILPDTLTYISDLAFYNSGIVEADIGNGVEYIGKYAFYNNWKNYIMTRQDKPDIHFRSDGIVHIKLSDSLKYIGEYAFYKNSIAGIKLPEGLEFIGPNAFSNNNLYLVEIPDSVNYIGKDAFSGLAEDKIKLGKGYTYYLSIDNDTIIGHIASPSATLVIPSIPGVNKIKSEAFYDYADITKVVIDEGIEYIGANAFKPINRLAPKRTVTLPKSIKYVSQRAFSYYDYHIFNTIDPSQLNKIDFVDKSSSNPLYDFRQNRSEIVSENITQTPFFEEINPVKDWVQRYVCAKYKDKDILSCDVSYSYLSDVSNITDVHSCDSYVLKATMYEISLKTNIDIEGMAKNESGYYYLQMQVIYAEDKINNQLTLCGFLNQQELLTSREALYEYIKEDGRFTLNEYVLSKKLSQIEENIETNDLSNCSVIKELTKGVAYYQESYNRYETYLPSGEDCVIFYVHDPINKLYKVNYKANEIVWEKSYDISHTRGLEYTDRFPNEQNDVFEFKYYIGNYELHTDYIDTDGKAVVLDASEPYQEDLISGTDWKVISDNGNIYLENTKTQRKSIIANHAENTSQYFTESRFVKAINSNQIIIESSFSGESSLHCWHFIYNIDTGYLEQLQVNNNDYYLITNINDVYVNKIINDYYNTDTLLIYNSSDHTTTNIREWTDYFFCINAHAVSKDGRYLALLTTDSFTTDGWTTTYANTGIIIIDLEHQKALVQDELILSHGSLSFLSDNTLVINDMKTMMYIDVPSIE